MSKIEYRLRIYINVIVFFMKPCNTIVILLPIITELSGKYYWKFFQGGMEDVETFFSRRGICDDWRRH